MERTVKPAGKKRLIVAEKAFHTLVQSSVLGVDSHYCESGGFFEVENVPKIPSDDFTRFWQVLIKY